jgi:hypothetical protein
MNKQQIMNKLYERDYIDKLHRIIKEGFVGSLRNEYLLQKPVREPYEIYVKETNNFLSLPIFHAFVDTLTASLLYSISKELVTEVLSAIEDIELQDITKEV